MRWRTEPAALILFAFFLVFFLNVVVYGDPDHRSIGGYLYAAGWNLVLCFFFAVLLEMVFALVRMVGAAFLRTGKLWTYSVPALSVFALIVHPLLTAGGMLDVVLHAKGMTMGIYVTFLLSLSLLVFVILLVLPVFHGLNAAFLLAGIVVARLVLLPLENLLFPHDASFSMLLFLQLIVVCMVLAALFYAFFLTRRRLGLSPHYERFRPGRLWFATFLPVLLAGPVGLVILRDGRRLFHPLLDVFYLNLITALALVVLFMLFVLRREAGDRRGVRLPPMQTVAFLGILLLLVLAGLLRGYRPEYVFFARETAAGRFLELVSVTADRDHDGNSFWPGRDPDDGNDGVRREGRGEYRNQGLGDIRSSGYAGIDRVLVTVVVPGSLERNPLYENTGSIELEFSGPGPRYWMQPSNVPERSLRALMQGLTSLEESHGLVKRSLMSIAAEDGYRTLCLGMDDGSGYFRLEHSARLDRGCQVFERIPVPEARVVEGESPITTCLSSALQSAEKIVEQYREKHTFVWIHLDTRQCRQPEAVHAGSAEERERLEAERNLSIRKASGVALARLKSFHSEYYWLSNSARRLLIVHMQTGYLPLFHVNARDEFWRAKDGDFLYSGILSGHLFFFRWYFADSLRRSEEGKEEKAGSMLRDAERTYQAASTQDLNHWIFLQESPDENVRWFREVIGLEGAEHRLPASLLFYDVRNGRIHYSHGMWNRLLTFREKPNATPEIDDSEEPGFFVAPVTASEETAPDGVAPDGTAPASPVTLPDGQETSNPH